MDRLRYSLNRARSTSCPRKLRRNRGRIVIGRRRQRHRFAAESLAHDIRRYVEGAALPVSPDAEQKPPTGPQHAPRLAETCLLIGEEHDTELADHVIEQPITKRQRDSVRV